MKKTLWVLLDSRTGSVGQARGVVQQLNPENYDISEKILEYTKLSGLPNFLRGKTLIGLSPESKKQIAAPFPDMVLSTSRRTVPVARFIKKQNRATKLIQLMHPGRTGLKEFDLALVPEHDKNKVSYPNIKYIVGAPHRMTPKALNDAEQVWAPRFADLPKPLTAVVVGGAIKGKEFSLENAAELGKKIKELKQKIGGSVLITTSRRTGAKAEKTIMDAIAEANARGSGVASLKGKMIDKPVVTRARRLLAARKSRRAAARNLRQKGLSAQQVAAALEAVYAPDDGAASPAFSAEAAAGAGLLTGRRVA